jgi:hypothetical protein
MKRLYAAALDASFAIIKIMQPKDSMLLQL